MMKTIKRGNFFLKSIKEIGRKRKVNQKAKDY